MRDLAESLAYLSRERLGQGKKRVPERNHPQRLGFFSCFPPLRHWDLGANYGAAFPEKVRQCCNAAVW